MKLLPAERSEAEQRTLREKMHQAFVLSVKITTHDETAPDWVYLWADGLNHKYVHSRMDGRCSLSDLLDFDLTEFEAQVDQELQQMETMI